MQPLKQQINYEEFSKVDIRVGTIISAEEIEGSEKLLKLQVDFGELGQKQILSGIKKWYSPQDLQGLQVFFVLNLEPRKMMGLESQGMILATDAEDASEGDSVEGQNSKPILLTPKETAKNGVGIR